jgi:hypothetical protein
MCQDNDLDEGSTSSREDRALQSGDSAEAWAAAEQIMAEFRDHPDDVRVNYVGALIYPLLRKRSGNGWMPIASAPQFKHVLLWFPNGEHVIALMGPNPSCWETVGYWGDDEATHWQPLPLPPEGSEK